MVYLKDFVISAVLLLVLDGIWFKLFMQEFAANQLRPLLRLNEDGSLNVNLFFAAASYVVMALFVVAFLIPKIKGMGLGQALAVSALLGFCAFGIFDFTNAAIIKKYSTMFVIADVAWGTFMYTVMGGVFWFLKTKGI